MTAKTHQRQIAREKIAQEQIAWPESYRIIRAELFSVSRIDDIAATDDWALLESSGSKSKSASAEQTRNLFAIPGKRRIPLRRGAEVVLKPFIDYSRARPSRFSDGSYGVWYAAAKEETALHERLYHYRKNILATAATKNIPSASGFQTLLSPVDCRLHNVNNLPEVLDADDYGAAQKLGASLRNADSNGVVWNSVRHSGGKCIGLFWPDVVGRPVKYGTQFTFQWDGRGEIVVKNHRTGKVIAVN